MKKIVSVILLACLFVYGAVAFADRVAIIGGGASGLVTAWLIEQNHDVTLYEAQDRLGGHANSIEVNVDGSPVVIEAGAEFFNEAFYPHFMRLLRYFNIPLRPFTLVSTFYTTDGKDVIILPPYHDGTIEWKSLTPGNLYRSVQLKIVIDSGRKLLETHDTTPTLQQFVDTLTISKGFKTSFLYPLLAAAWGVSPNDVQDAAAYNTLKYIVEGNDVKGYQWYEVTGGLKKYIEAVRDSLQKTEIRLNARVKQIGKNNGHYTVWAEDGSVKEFDHVVFATDASVASYLLGTMPETADLSALLGKIRYYDTKIAIHGDARFMPPNKDDWRVVNVRYDGTHSATTMYKQWKSKTPIFKTWLTYDVRPSKDTGSALPGNLYALINYKHPMTDHYYFEVQKAVEQLQGNNNLWFAGMWTYDNDSHESAIISAIKVAERLAPDSGHLKILQNQVFR
jgi:predicted NAD/FAD-binding protein